MNLRAWLALLAALGVAWLAARAARRRAAGTAGGRRFFKPQPEPVKPF